MCYHTHSSPNESIDFAVLWCTQSIDSFGKNGDIFSICTIYIFQTFFGTFPMTFLQKFSNQKVQFSIKINNIPKKPFEKSVRNLSIHLKLLWCVTFQRVSWNHLSPTICSVDQLRPSSYSIFQMLYSEHFWFATNVRPTVASIKISNRKQGTQNAQNLFRLVYPNISDQVLQSRIVNDSTKAVLNCAP